MAKENNVEVGSAFDLLGKSYEIVKKNWQAFLFVNILTLLSSLAQGFDDEDKYEKNYAGLTGFDAGAALGIVGAVAVVFAVVNIFLYLMMVVLETRAAGGKKPSISELANEALNKSLRLIGLIILLVIIAIVSFLLLIVPFIFALPRIIMAPYIMVDKNLGVMDTLSESFKLGKTYFGKIWGAIGVMILIAIGAAIVSAVPVIGPIAGSLIIIAFSLVLPLRYFQLKKA